ncbi:MAG TPA: hypothetical protein V6C65_14185, partial [Allocoleopsis sp.]
DKIVRLWNLQGQPVGEPFQGQGWISSVVFSPDGQMIVSGSWDDTVWLWNLQGQPIREPLQGQEVYCVEFSPDGNTIISGNGDATICLWDISTGECLQVIDYRLCAGLNITATTGLTPIQRTALKLMGAFEEEGE